MLCICAGAFPGSPPPLPLSPRRIPINGYGTGEYRYHTKKSPQIQGKTLFPGVSECVLPLSTTCCVPTRVCHKIDALGAVFWGVRFFLLLFFFWILLSTFLFLEKEKKQRKRRYTSVVKGALPERPLPRVPSPVSRSQPCGKTSAQNASCHSMCQKLFCLQCQGFPNRHRECQGHYFVRLTKRRRRQKCFLLP